MSVELLTELTVPILFKRRLIDEKEMVYVEAWMYQEAKLSVQRKGVYITPLRDKNGRIRSLWLNKQWTNAKGEPIPNEYYTCELTLTKESCAANGIEMTMSKPRKVTDSEELKKLLQTCMIFKNESFAESQV